MAMKTKGTRLYVIDPTADSDGPNVLEVGCVTSISGLNTDIPQVETTCLSSEGREYVGGMPTPGNATFGINFDSADISHVRLHQLKVAGANLKWAIGAGQQGDAPPTLDSNGTDFELPLTRTWWTFDGFLSAYPFDFAINDVVKSTIGIQVSGDPVLHPKSA